MKTKNLDQIFKFFYVEKLIKQKSFFAGQPDIIKSVPVGVYHIDFRGRLICGQSREVIKNAEKGIPKSGNTRPQGIPCCPVCDKGWRENPESEYYKFVHGRDIASAKVGVESSVRK